MSELTIGEKRVRIEFNPSNDDTVFQIKQLAANFINACESLKEKDDRCADYAQSLIETACMYAVKAATS